MCPLSPSHRLLTILAYLLLLGISVLLVGINVLLGVTQPLRPAPDCWPPWALDMAIDGCSDPQGFLHVPIGRPAACCLLSWKAAGVYGTSKGKASSFILCSQPSLGKVLWAGTGDPIRDTSLAICAGLPQTPSHCLGPLVHLYSYLPGDGVSLHQVCCVGD